MEHYKSAKAENLFDFRYLDHLTVQPAGQGRVFLGRVAAVSTGEPVLLFVHGGYHGAWCFAHYLEYFDAQGIPAAALDMRGHGGLPQNSEFHLAGVRDMAEDVIAACAVLSGPPILVGHSAGALVAAAAGETVPLFGFGLLAPSPPGQLEILKPVPLVSERAPFGPPDEDTSRSKFLAGEPWQDMDPYLARLCAESPRMLNDRYSLRIRIDPGKFGMPALCLAAGRDTNALHPPGQDQATADFFKATFIELETAPHCMMISIDWRNSAQILMNWYRRLVAV